MCHNFLSLQKLLYLFFSVQVLDYIHISLPHLLIFDATYLTFVQYHIGLLFAIPGIVYQIQNDSLSFQNSPKSFEKCIYISKKSICNEGTLFCYLAENFCAREMMMTIALSQNDFRIKPWLGRRQMIQLRHFGRKIWNFITILLLLHQGVQILEK